MVKIINEAEGNKIGEVELLDFIDQIDFNELSNVISNRLGTTVKLVPGEAEKYRDYSRVDYVSYAIDVEPIEVIEKCGIISSLLDSVVIEINSSWAVMNEDTNKPQYLCHVELDLGAGRAINICKAIFTLEDGWRIMTGDMF